MKELMYLYFIAGFILAIYNQTRPMRTDWLRLQFSDVRGIDFLVSFILGPLVLTAVAGYFVLLVVLLLLSAFYVKVNRESRADNLVRNKLVHLIKG